MEKNNQPVTSLFGGQPTSDLSLSLNTENKNEKSERPTFTLEDDEDLKSLEQVAERGVPIVRVRHPTAPDAENSPIFSSMTGKSSSFNEVFASEPSLLVDNGGTDESDGLDDVDGPLSQESPRERRPSLPKTIFAKGKDLIRNSFGKGKMKKNLTSNDVGMLTHRMSFTDTIYDYTERTKTNNGVFLLLAFFTNDLKGYRHDIKELRCFFENDLGYTYREAINCTQQQMYHKIEETKRLIRDLKQEKKTPSILIVTILTHGEEDGIHTCQDIAGIIREKDADKKVKVTKHEDIFAKFKHDEENLPEFKGHPKLFFVQSCYGEEIVRAAGGSGSDSSLMKELEDHLPCQPTLPVDADLYVASATTKYNQAFVSDEGGSWFINSLLAVFRKLHRNTDVETMLKAVTYDVSEKRKAVTLTDGSQAVAAQVPLRQSTLRKNCYL